MDTLLLEADAWIESADKQKLQGTWNTVSGRREAELLVAGGHFTVKFNNGDIYLGTFTLDPTQEPHAIDMVICEGPERHRGKTSLGIYELSIDRFLWSPGDPGTGERPADFPPVTDKEHLCLVFEREKHGPAPAPRAGVNL
jgi:uncharacterized protein (TIGR03067 family)